jgi:hypothetical protein
VSEFIEVFILTKVMHTSKQKYPKVGARIRYTHYIGRERIPEERTGVVELRDFHTEEGPLETRSWNTECWLVKCDSCAHHRIDTVHPDDIIEIIP